ncbi:uncharacterized protein LOC8269964 isoform X2 [Ricinus communis]|uniref:uncharacterized protein LOC8269964 isoform X2 n=1 Tax=Ricinus communis TaxID=3988 RepID=UPI00201AFB14|nr:uncharacterized protein LOC8269964 isoform X2 [Ricinus communis]XP_048227384.1 uncharacterized protein LOC8269964 isoform X2 [Ricinus communis]XP_048227385.1 uncharacterized protein LOC8269964 isoform X2 [Ricinus communis]XP_048227386.1 uncharacterized protein LOC8269964 isoform X2 [Ricinus communis]XP_048227387.1 uncharacterized protein LOC8269964 isoform X2 [Ricinus communis]
MAYKGESAVVCCLNENISNGISLVTALMTSCLPLSTSHKNRTLPSPLLFLLFINRSFSHLPEKQTIQEIMGSCFSCSVFSESDLLPPAANVVSINGTLRQYNVPVIASQVLDAEAASSSSSSSTSFFLCNSDFLSYDDLIPALDSDAQLYANQLYFILPKSKLQNRLTAPDMAALAVKASVALQNASKNEAHRRKKARISPVLLVNQSSSQRHLLNPTSGDAYPRKTFQKAKGEQPPVGMGFSRSGSVRRLHRYQYVKALTKKKVWGGAHKRKAGDI